MSYLSVSICTTKWFKMVNQVFAQPFFVWSSDLRSCEDCYGSLTKDYMGTSSWMLSMFENNAITDKRVMCKKCHDTCIFLEALKW